MRQRLAQIKQFKPGAYPRFWAAFIFFFATVVTTWPVLIEPNQWLLFSERRFDGYGTAWFADHVWQFVTGERAFFFSAEINHPTGLDLRLADSFLFGFLALPISAFASPVATFNLFSIFAIAATAYAGFKLAIDGIQAGWIASIACGFIVGFNSAVMSYRIEGEAYLLASFFLPLLALEGIRLVREPTPMAGVRGALYIGALAWSSGYLAVNAFLVTSVLGGLLLVTQRRMDWHALRTPALVFVGGAILLVGPVLMLISAGGADSVVEARFPSGEVALKNIAQDSVSLSGLLIPYSASAPLRQDRIFSLGMVPILFGLSAIMMVGWRRTIPWLGLTAVGVIFAMGPTLKLTDGDAGILLLPYGWLVALVPNVVAYRMPLRFLTIAFLGLGVLAALFIDALNKEGISRSWLFGLLTAVIIEALVFTGALTDPAFTPVEVPVGYSQVSKEGAVLDLRGHDRYVLRDASLSTFYQLFHGQPVLADHTQAIDRQDVLARALGLALVERETASIRAILGLLHSLNVTDIAFHPRSFQDTDALQMRTSLVAHCPAVNPLAEPGDDPVEIFRVPDSSKQIPLEDALQTVDGWIEEWRDG